jgi:hypothetical protein
MKFERTDMIFEQQTLIEIKTLIKNDAALKKAIKAANGPQEFAQKLSDASTSDRIQAAAQALKEYFSSSAFQANGELTDQSLDSVVGGVNWDAAWMNIRNQILI